MKRFVYCANVLRWEDRIQSGGEGKGWYNKAMSTIRIKSNRPIWTKGHTRKRKKMAWLLITIVIIVTIIIITTIIIVTYLRYQRYLEQPNRKWSQRLVRWVSSLGKQTQSPLPYINKINLVIIRLKWSDKLVKYEKKSIIIYIWS